MRIFAQHFQFKNGVKILDVMAWFFSLFLKNFEKKIFFFQEKNQRTHYTENGEKKMNEFY